MICIQLHLEKSQSLPQSESGDPDDNEDPHASDSEATASVGDLIGMSSSSSGIHQVEEAVLEAPENAEDLDINDGMS
jgi:hypothetical protein